MQSAIVAYTRTHLDFVWYGLFHQQHVTWNEDDADDYDDDDGVWQRRLDGSGSSTGNGNNKRINMVYLWVLRGINQPTMESISSLLIEDAYIYEQWERMGKKWSERKSWNEEK